MVDRLRGWWYVIERILTSDDMAVRIIAIVVVGFMLWLTAGQPGIERHGCSHEAEIRELRRQLQEFDKHAGNIQFTPYEYAANERQQLLEMLTDGDKTEEEIEEAIREESARLKDGQRSRGNSGPNTN